MSVHVYRAVCAEARARQEIAAHEFFERVTGRRSTHRQRRRRRDAARAISEANRHWIAAVVHLLTWGLS